MGFPDVKGVIGGLVDRARQVGQDAVEAGRNVVDQGVQAGREVVREGQERLRDGWEQVEQKAGPVLDILQGNNPDNVNDGRLVDREGNTYPPGTPPSQVGAQDPNRPTVLYVNGVGNDVAAQQRTLNVIGERTGANTVGVHNGTRGHLWDLGQAVLDKVDKGTNPAVDSLADTVYSELQAGRPVHLMAHSQGAIITSRALQDVKERLMAEDGLTEAQAEERLSGVQVETFGGAASWYPDGPQYVHYVNRADPVATEAGLGYGVPLLPGQPGGPPRSAGRDAVVHYFTENHATWQDPLAGLDNHAINTTYLNHRVPFEQARRGDFETRPTEPAL